MYDTLFREKGKENELINIYLTLNCYIIKILIQVKCTVEETRLYKSSVG